MLSPLNPFPIILALSFFAPLILRLVAGLIIFNMGMLALRDKRMGIVLALKTLRTPYPKLIAKKIAIIEIAAGIMFILGWYTQIAAVVICLLLLCEMVIEYKSPELIKRSFTFFLLLFAISLSLLITGAGAFAFDIPL